METSGGNTEGFRNSAPRRYGMPFSAANIIQAPLTALLEYSGLLRGRSHHHESEATTALTAGGSLRDHHPNRVDDAGNAEVSIRIIGAGEQEHVRVGAGTSSGSHGRNAGETESGNGSNNHLQASSPALQSSQTTGGVEFGTGVGGSSASMSPLSLSAGGNGEADAGNNNSANGRDTAYQRYDIQQLARWIEQILPFSLLLLVPSPLKTLSWTIRRVRSCTWSPTPKNRWFVVMEAGIRPPFGHGLIIFPPSHMGFRLFGSFNVRTIFRGPHQRQPAGIMKTSEVDISSVLRRKHVIVAAKRSIFDDDNQITVDSEDEMPKEEIAASSNADNGDSETVVNEVEGFDGKESVTEGNVSQGGSIQVQKMDRRESNSGTKLLDSWSSWNAQYQKDIRVWGVGRAPVFVVYQSGDAEVVKVLVNEDEILRRFGAVPFLADRPDETAISIAQAKIAQAKQLARDIEAGVFIPPGNSTVFEFVKPAKNDLGKQGLLGSVFCQARSVIAPAPPALKISLVGFLLLSGFGLVWAARKYMFRNAQMLGKEIDGEEPKISMRRIDSTMEKEETDGGMS